VIVHAGFAISQLDEAEAAITLEILRQMGDLAEWTDAGADAAPGPGSDALR